MKLDQVKQDHEPLAVSAFTGNSAEWSVPEKEGFAVVECMCRMDYLLLRRIVSIYTDHANLVYLYDPYGKNPGIARHTANKLMRWALKLNSFRYVIEYLPGERNFWAVRIKDSVPGTSIKIFMVAPVTHSLNLEYDWPTLSGVTYAQKNTSLKYPRRFSNFTNVIKNQKGVLWVPMDAKELQLRILVAGHCGMGGHRGYRTTQKAIGSYCWWDTINRDVEVFVRSCLHCLSTEKGETIPRSLGHALHANKQNEIMHFDYCFTGEGEGDKKYILVLKDDFSGYVWLVVTEKANAEETVRALISWFAAFGVVIQWVPIKERISRMRSPEN